VENGIVWGSEEMWLLLGEVIEGYEPIVFQEGRFRVNAVHHAACAVLRVTALGAMAYTRFHGESLPTEEQWMYAAKAGGTEPPATVDMSGASSGSGISGHGEAEGHGSPAPSSKARTFPPVPSPVMLYPANRLGIRGLNANIGEWGLTAAHAPAQGGTEQREYVVMGGAQSQSAQGTSNLHAIRRYPWEAFSDVGFRGVREISSSTKSAELPAVKREPTKPDPE